MQHGHSPLPREGGALANIPDRVFDRGARRESVIARIHAPDDAAVEIPQPRDVALASGAVASHPDSSQQGPVVAYNERAHFLAPRYDVGHDDQPDEGPAPVPPIQLVNFELPSKPPNVANPARIEAFCAVSCSNWPARYQMWR